MSRPRTALFALPLVALAAFGCDSYTCDNDETIVVDEVGTCAPAPTRTTLSSLACRVFLSSSSGSTGLPARGAMSQSPRPLRQGDFILYGDDSSTGFRLCRAQRVEFRLELACVDAQGAAVCNATLTEPGP